MPDPVGTPAAVADPFWSDAKAGANPRTFHMNRDILDNTPTRPTRRPGRSAAPPSGGPAGGPLPDETELNVGVAWTYRDKGSILDDLRVRARAGWITDKTPAGDTHTTDYRIDVNLPIVVF